MASVSGATPSEARKRDLSHDLGKLCHVLAATTQVRLCFDAPHTPAHAPHRTHAGGDERTLGSPAGGFGGRVGVVEGGQVEAIAAVVPIPVVGKKAVTPGRWIFIICLNIIL